MSRAVAVIILSTGLAACVMPRPIRQVERPGDRAAIEDFTRGYAAAFVAGDVDGIVRFVTDDFVALTPGRPAVIGKSELRDALLSDLEERRVVALNFIHDEVIVTGDWAWARGRTRALWRPQPDVEPVAVRGKYLWILRRYPDNRWKLARDSASGNHPE